MIEDLAFFLSTKGIWLDLASSVVLFISIVLALLSKKLPYYHEKPLYFVGFFSFMNAMTIFASLTLGPLSAMSHQKIGNISESAIMAALAIVGAQFLWRYYRSNEPEASAPKAKTPKKPTHKTVRRK